MRLVGKVWLWLLLLPLSAWAQINTDRMMIMGRMALSYEDYVLSIQRFNMVINAKPYLSEPYFFRGLAKFYLEDYSGAAQDCDKSIELNPFRPDSYQLRGLCRVNRKEYEGAAEDYRKVVELSPMNKPSRHNLVLCYLEMKQYDEADAALDSMIRLWPAEAENYTLKAQVSLLQGDTVQALAHVDRALQVNAYEGKAWSLKAMIDLQAGRYPEAEEAFDKAILQLPREHGLYINRALARFHRKDLRGAMEDYDTALEIFPGSYLGHFNRGLLRAQVGDDNRAIEDFNFVLEQEPDNMIALFNRALLLDNTGDYRGAIRDVSTVIDAYPEFWTGYSYRASVRRKVGDVKGAEQDEFKVMKATLERRYGGARPKNDKPTRKQSERNMDDFDKLVVADTDESVNQYANEYRGRVQDRQVDLEPEPIYVLSFYRKNTEINQKKGYHPLVEALNNSGLLWRTLYITNSEQALDEESIRLHQASIAGLTEDIARRPDDARLYLVRALENYMVYDLESAMKDIEKCVALDSSSVLGYWVRAQVRAKMQLAEVQEGTSAQPEPLKPNKNDRHIAFHSLLADWQEAARLAPDFIYTYYNIGTFHLRLEDYRAAEDAFTEAITREPAFAEAYYNRGIVRIKAGRIKEATADLSRAGELGLYKAYNLIKRYSKDEGKN
ncbi:MAG: tetratricopeptide repeat protein [Paraprevotella sp.]|nr:tetratricopeptide repeat protein [Paraprevotella sp.]